MDYVEKDGRRYKVECEPDDCNEAPWKQCDGHGPVSEWTTRAKCPGELVLAKDRSARLYYDFAAAVKIARREKWDAPPYGQGTAGEQAVRAVRSDFEYLRAWVRGDWYYMGVVVTDRETNERASLWGIESDSGDYIGEVVDELIGELRAIERNREIAKAFV